MRWRERAPQVIDLEGIIGDGYLEVVTLSLVYVGVGVYLVLVCVGLK